MNRPKHLLDDLFRHRLADLEISPTPSGRSDFLKKAEKELNERSKRTWWFIGSGAGILFLFIAGIILFDSGTKTVQKVEQRSIKSNIVTEPSSAVSPGNVSAGSPHYKADKSEKIIPSVHSSSDRGKKENSSLIPTLAGRATQRNDIKSSETSKTDALPMQAEPASVNAATAEAAEPSIQPGENKDEAATASRVVSPATGTHDSTPETPISLPKYDTMPVPAKNKKHLRSKEWNFDVGIYYTPEWIFNTLDSNKYVNNFGVEGMFRFGPYSIRTGIGLSITRGYNQVVIETQPYLGSFQSLEYITYQWDENHYHLVPTIHTSLSEVFDTALHYNYYYYEKQYTYLQIPLVLGYDFLMKKNWSLGVRTGPVMSVLLKSRVLTKDFDPGKDRIVNMNDITPDRVQLNWQAMAGINAAYHLPGRITLELEPDIRYYFNSVYEKKNKSDKPWSAGFRAAIMIKL